MRFIRYSRGVRPDSGRRKKLLKDRRCPGCFILVHWKDTSCRVCGQLLFCPQKDYRQKIIMTAALLSFLYLVLVVLFMLFISWISSD